MTTQSRGRGLLKANKHALAVAASLLMGAQGLHAMELATGNADLEVRLDTTLRYNLGLRVESQDGRLAHPATRGAYDEGDAKFQRGDIINNRLDVLSEFDINYRKLLGARVSAAAWYDLAYNSTTVSSPAGYATSYFNNRYNNTVDRYIHGPSGEFLDAFVWSNFKVGDAPFNVKLGRHAIVWGEGLLIPMHAISYSQQPLDGGKAVASPGIETKETFLPIGQLSFTAQLTEKFSIAGQYAYEWKPTRAPYGGTYLSAADTSPNVDRLPLAPTASGGFAATNKPANTPGDTGNWGLSAKLNVDAIESQVGAYYRKFNDYNPEGGFLLGNFYQLIPGNAATTTPGTFQFQYPRNIKLFGLSLARPFGPVSVGAEVSWRQNAALISTSTWTNPSATAARGDTFHAVVNGTYLLPQSNLWDTGNVLVELAYSNLRKVTANAANYKGVGYAACLATGTTVAASGGVDDGCATKSYWEVAVKFVPQYLNIIPSWDMTLPVNIGYGLKGNASTTGGGNEGTLNWSVGVTAIYNNQHEFSLQYADKQATTKYNATATAAIGGNGNFGTNDRGRVQFTYKTSF